MPGQVKWGCESLFFLGRKSMHVHKNTSCHFGPDGSKRKLDGWDLYGGNRVRIFMAKKYNPWRKLFPNNISPLRNSPGAPRCKLIDWWKLGSRSGTYFYIQSFLQTFCNFVYYVHIFLNIFVNINNRWRKTLFKNCCYTKFSIWNRSKSRAI